ncbi:MAG TPA: cytochrome c-type biogenesis protein [Xanthobacteraceae bacterium]
MRRVALALFAVLLSTATLAVEPDEMLSDPALETRARALSQTLRCMVCQNESIDESHAPLARDIRILVRERIAAGDSDAAVRDYLVARYGEFILLAPRFRPSTALLWGLPVLILLIALVKIAVVFARRGAMVPPSLSTEERRRLDTLLGKNKKT